MNRNLRALAAALLAGAAAGGALAGGCTVSSSGLAFGAYQPLTFAGKLTSIDRTSDATVSVVCTGIVTGGDFTLSLGPSSVGNSMNPRLMSNPQGGTNMQFNIYREASYLTVWGDGSGGSLIAGTIPTGSSSQSFTVYGKVPAGQSTLRVGSYSASLVMTVTYDP